MEYYRTIDHCLTTAAKSSSHWSISCCSLIGRLVSLLTHQCCSLCLDNGWHQTLPCPFCWKSCCCPQQRTLCSHFCRVPYLSLCLPIFLTDSLLDSKKATAIKKSADVELWDAFHSPACRDAEVSEINCLQVVGRICCQLWLIRISCRLSQRR